MVSPGCWNCHTFRTLRSKGCSTATVQRATTKEFQRPLRYRGKYVQVCQHSDFFIAQADEWRAEAWEIMRLAPNKVFQLLTKRPGRIRKCLPDDWGEHGWPNVYLGVSAETQQYADSRIPQMLSVPAAKYFVSAQPLLGPVDLREWLGEGMVSMVASGCESGPNARPAREEWLESLDEQCAAVGIRNIISRWNNEKGEVIEGDFHDGRVSGLRNHFPFRPKNYVSLRHKALKVLAG